MNNFTGHCDILQYLYISLYLTMSSNNKTIIAFDLYGTLLSTESIATELASHFGEEKARSIAASWRRYQLEYTWRMNSMCISPSS
jgi:2-haloacid dehalogenase